MKYINEYNNLITDVNYFFNEFGFKLLKCMINVNEFEYTIYFCRDNGNDYFEIHWYGIYTVTKITNKQKTVIIIDDNVDVTDIIKLLSI